MVLIIYLLFLCKNSLFICKKNTFRVRFFHIFNRLKVVNRTLLRGHFKLHFPSLELKKKNSFPIHFYFPFLGYILMLLLHHCSPTNTSSTGNHLEHQSVYKPYIILYSETLNNEYIERIHQMSYSSFSDNGMLQIFSFLIK